MVSALLKVGRWTDYFEEKWLTHELIIVFRWLLLVGTSSSYACWKVYLLWMKVLHILVRSTSMRMRIQLVVQTILDIYLST